MDVMCLQAVCWMSLAVWGSERHGKAVENLFQDNAGSDYVCDALSRF